ncbi:unnamed protein product, partial [marine sediment metagenome]
FIFFKVLPTLSKYGKRGWHKTGLGSIDDVLPNLP